MESILPPGFTLLQVVPRLEAGGVEQATLDMAAAVVAAGGRSIVASSGGGMVERLAGEHVEMPLHAKNPATILANAGRLARLVRARSVSLIHVRSRAPAFSAHIAGRRTGTPVVATYHGIYSAKGPIKRWYNGVMTRGALVLANSDFTRDHILEQHQVDPAHVVVAPEGVDQRRFDPNVVDAARVARMRERLGGKAGTALLLVSARLTGWKGQWVAIEALARLSHPATLALAGRAESDAYLQRLHALAARRDVGDRVRFAGDIENVPAALAAADLVLAPSTSPESFGRGVVEAALMQRPVVVSDLGAHRQTVEAGVTGWLTPPGDVDALAGAIDHALSLSPEALAGMGAAARLRAAERFGLEAMVAATFAAYRQALAAR